MWEHSRRDFKKVPKWWHQKQAINFFYSLITRFSVAKINTWLHNNNNNNNNNNNSNNNKEAMESRRIGNYKTKEQQSQFYKEQEDKRHLWLSQNLHGRKTSSIMTVREQMVKTRSWKAARGLVQDGYWRVCHDETIEHLVAGCKVLANTKYLLRRNRALTVMAVAWVKECKLVGGDLVW